MTERNLAITTGLGNLLAAPFGGYPMCHGAGGIAGHYRFGARTATAPLLIGLAFLAMGVLLGDGAIALLALVPAAVLGSLLFFSGIELALAASPQRYAGEAWAVVLVIAVISVTASPAVAFVLGWALAVAIRRGAITPLSERSDREERSGSVRRGYRRGGRLPRRSCSPRKG